jgi:hypothetical protein
LISTNGKLISTNRKLISAMARKQKVDIKNGTKTKSWYQQWRGNRELISTNEKFQQVGMTIRKRKFLTLFIHSLFDSPNNPFGNLFIKFCWNEWVISNFSCKNSTIFFKSRSLAISSDDRSFLSFPFREQIYKFFLEWARFFAGMSQ